MRILGVDNLVLTVADLDRARAFYGGLLGLDEKYHFPERGVAGYRIGDEEPGLVLRHEPEALPSELRGPRIWLEVPDARLAAEELKRSGVAILGGPRDIRTGVVVELADPFGHVIGLVDYSVAPQLARDPRA